MCFKDHFNKFIRPKGNSCFGICDKFGIKLLTKIRVDFSDLRDHRSQPIKIIQKVLTTNQSILYKRSYLQTNQKVLCTNQSKGLTYKPINIIQNVLCTNQSKLYKRSYV